MGAKKHVRVGMIGYNFMGKVHSHAYRSLPLFFDTGAVPVLQAIAGRNENNVKTAAEKMGYLSYETDWRRLIDRDDIDLIDVSTPNNMHAEIVLAALQANKHVICEKPLAMSAQQAKQMLEATYHSNCIHMVCHNYRFSPAVQFAKKLIADGKIGKIYHFRATYLQDWIMDPEHPMVWRLNKEITGSGSHGDLAVHIIDLARFLIGEFEEVVGMMETFIKRRKSGEHSGDKGFGNVVYEDVTVDDASVFLSRFANGALGVFEATRFAGGNRNGNRFEINGEKGSIRWDLENMNNLQVYFAEDEIGSQGFRTINCTEIHHPYAEGYWASGHILGYETTFINLFSELMRGISGDYCPQPNFLDGFENQIVLSAVEKSAMHNRWVKISEVKNDCNHSALIPAETQ